MQGLRHLVPALCGTSMRAAATTRHAAAQRPGCPDQPNGNRRARSATSSGWRLVPVLTKIELNWLRTVPMPTPCRAAISRNCSPVASADATRASRRVSRKARRSVLTEGLGRVLRSTRIRRASSPWPTSGRDLLHRDAARPRRAEKARFGIAALQGGQQRGWKTHRRIPGFVLEPEVRSLQDECRRVIARQNRAILGAEGCAVARPLQQGKDGTHELHTSRSPLGAVVRGEAGRNGHHCHWLCSPAAPAKCRCSLHDGREERFFAGANYPCDADRPVRPL